MRRGVMALRALAPAEERVDPQALEQLYLRHRQGLVSLALAVTGCPAAAEDAVHEAFARLCRRAPDQARSESAYVYAAVRNAALDYRRRNRSVPSAAEALFNGGWLRDGVSAEERERDQLIRKAVDELPEEQREAVVLRIYAGLTFEEMAEAAGAPVATVAARYRRALERLKVRLRRHI
jgi:RNA polymerase sigma-70 factor (ECF subfamily)